MAVNALTDWKIVGGVFVFYGNGGTFSLSDYNRWLAALHDYEGCKYVGGAGSTFAIAPNERTAGRDYFIERKMPFATVTDSRVLRGMVTAGSWFGMNIAAFSWKDGASCMKWLDLYGEPSKKVLHELEQLRQGVEAKILARSASTRCGP